MIRTLTIAAVASLALGAAALAQDKGKSANPPGWQGGANPPGWNNTQGQRKGWNSGTTPPGWSTEQGQRKGWNGQTTPPSFQRK